MRLLWLLVKVSAFEGSSDNTSEGLAKVRYGWSGEAVQSVQCTKVADGCEMHQDALTLEKGDRRAQSSARELPEITARYCHRPVPASH